MEYYIYLNDEQKGPYTRDQIINMYGRSEINEKTLIWCQNFSDWKMLSETEFYSVSNSAESDLSKVFSILNSGRDNIPFKVLDNEEVIQKLQLGKSFFTKGGEVILTNLRLYTKISLLTFSYSNTIHLKDISSIEYVTKGKLWILILIMLSVVSFLGVMITDSDNYSVTVVILFTLSFIIWLAFLIFLYLYTRIKVLVVTPDGGRPILIPSKGFSISKLSDLIEALHLAKLNQDN